MTTRLTMTLALFLIAAALLAGLALWNRLPQQMASHWNAADQVDGTLPKFWGVLLMPLTALGLLALFAVLPAIDPLRANIAKFRTTFNAFVILILVFLFYIHGLMLAWSLGYQNFRMSAALLPFLGILFIFVGFMLRRAKRNFFIGIRTPWTLSSDSVWDQTHQLGSILFMLCGALAFFGGFIGGVGALLLTLVPLIGSTLFLAAYSYVLYVRETRS
jgi:uncharacterized membrane protein